MITPLRPIAASVAKSLAPKARAELVVAQFTLSPSAAALCAEVVAACELALRPNAARN